MIQRLGSIRAQMEIDFRPPSCLQNLLNFPTSGLKASTSTIRFSIHTINKKIKASVSHYYSTRRRPSFRRSRPGRRAPNQVVNGRQTRNFTKGIVASIQQLCLLEKLAVSSGQPAKVYKSAVRDFTRTAA